MYEAGAAVEKHAALPKSGLTHSSAPGAVLASRCGEDGALQLCQSECGLSLIKRSNPHVSMPRRQAGVGAG